MSDVVAELSAGVLAGDRRSLAKAITLVESRRPEHRADALAVLDALLAHSGGAVRVGISGAPGVGKSTFIDALGRVLIAQDHRVAVLAVDPSSVRSGGSILGDKTRMVDLAREANAFIRPSPSEGTLGGVARRTREALLLCEAAGFDVVLVETVGVGQSETEVAGMVDCFVLLVQPGAGDEVQGIKRGIVEVADLVVVTKADRALAGAAAQAESDYRHALHFMRAKTPHWAPKVLRCSAVEGTGIDEVWTAVLAHQDAIATGDGLERERAAQAVASMWAEVRDLLVDSLTGQPTQAALAHELERKVRDGAMSPAAAAAALCRASTAPETPGGRGSP